MAGVPTSESPGDLEKRLVLLAVGALGVSSVMTQLALMRELLGTFGGNELVLGIVLGNWLLLTGVGAWLGRFAQRLRAPFRLLTWLQILVAVIPLAQIVLLRTLRNAVFGHGIAIGVTQSVVSSFLLLLPFCVVSGFFLTLACAILAARREPGAVAAVYVTDSLGSIAGGGLFTFWLVRWLDHFALLACAAFFSLAVAALLLLRLRAAPDFRPARLLFVAVVTLSAGLAVLLALVPVDAWSTARQFPQQRLVFRASSPYGKLVVTEAAGQLNFIYNGLPVLSSQQREPVEETVHYAMAQRPDARSVLLVGGGISGTATEVLRYGVAAVTYVELDPLILVAGRKFFAGNLADDRIRVVTTDGRRFIKNATGRFDVIILDVPDPSTSQINRLYTAEFFAEAKRILATNGVVALSVGRYENFVSPELGRLLSSTWHTLRTAFRQVRVIPGGRVYFLGSDGELTVDIAGRMERKGVTARLVNRHYLEAMLAPDRMADMQRATSQAAALNQDFNPVLYFYHLVHWMSQWQPPVGWIGGAVLVGLLVYLGRLRALSWVIFASGFAASALEVVLLLGFQVLYGSLYRQLGLMVTVFMAGLALGAFWINRRLAAGGRRELARLGFAVALFAALLPLVLLGLNRLTHTPALAWAVAAAIPVLTFLLAALVGAEFPLANHVASPGAASAVPRLYTADFIGASLGALLASTWMIPVLGLATTCLLTAALNLFGAVAVLVTKD